MFRAIYTNPDPPSVCFISVLSNPTPELFTASSSSSFCRRRPYTTLLVAAPPSSEHLNTELDAAASANILFSVSYFSNGDMLASV